MRKRDFLNEINHTQEEFTVSHPNDETGKGRMILRSKLSSLQHESQCFIVSFTAVPQYNLISPFVVFWKPDVILASSLVTDRRWV